MPFGLRVDLSRSHTRHQIVLSCCEELLLQDIDHDHGRHDVGDVTMHLQTCRLMARCLANHDRLNEVTHDRHQPALGLFVGVIAGEEDELAPLNYSILK
ncbi:MAG: hypothetical protein ACK4ZU_15695 [Allorhizobium sp.]